MKLALSTVLLLSMAFARAHAAPTPPEKPVVITQEVKKQELSEQLTYPARIVPLATASVLSEGDGMVKSIHVLLGQKVRRGQAIATLVNLDPVFQYTPMVVRAPLSGVLSAIEVGEGTQLNRGQLVAVVTDPARLKISVEVPALDLRSIRAGMTGEFHQQGQEKPFLVRVKGISSIVDPATGTAPCELVLDSKDAKSPKDAPTVFAGVLGRVILKANERKGFLIPEHAILFRGADPFVRVIELGKAKRVSVKLGSRQRGFVEVLEGLSEGATLIERSNKFVSDGDEVTIEPAGDSKAKGA